MSILGLEKPARPIDSLQTSRRPGDSFRNALPRVGLSNPQTELDGVLSPSARYHSEGGAATELRKLSEVFRIMCFAGELSPWSRSISMCAAVVPSW